MEYELSVPYIEQNDYLEGLFDRFGKGVSEVYLPLPSRNVGSGRAIYYSEIDYTQVCDICHDNAVKVDVLVNASCEGIEPYTTQGFNRMMSALKSASESGVDVVTVANPLYIPKIRDSFDFEIKVSVISKVASVQAALFYERLGVDSINLDRDINRDLGLIEDIRDAVSCKLYLLVNEGCLLDCPFKHFHDNLIGHISRLPANRRSGIETNPFADYCTAIKQKYPEDILKSPWIRPEDLEKYHSLVDGFKIAGRDLQPENMYQIVEAYLSEAYAGNLLDLLNAKTPGLRIDNMDLDGFFEKVTSCDRNCVKCGFCRDLAEKIVFRGFIS